MKIMQSSFYFRQLRHYFHQHNIYSLEFIQLLQAYSYSIFLNSIRLGLHMYVCPIILLILIFSVEMSYHNGAAPNYHVSAESKLKRESCRSRQTEVGSTPTMPPFLLILKT